MEYLNLVTLQSKQKEVGRKGLYRKWWVRGSHHGMIASCPELRYL